MSSSSESSSDEDDVPLAALKQPKAKKATPTRSSRRSSTGSKSYKEESEAEFEDESSDDDQPVASRKSPKNKTTAKKTKTKPKATKAKPTKAKADKPTKKKTKTKASSSSSASTSSKTYNTAAMALYDLSNKGKLIASLLSRWWYAMEWPDPKVTCAEACPPKCDMMDGFPGVFVVTTGSEIGKIIDKRDLKTCPNFKNMAKKSSEELVELLVKAIDKQQKELIEHDGEGTTVEKDLKTLKKWAQKLNCKTSDKEAEKVLKAHNLKIQ